MAKFRHQEESFQQACIQWFNMQYPKYNKCLFHVQQKARNSIEGAKFKKSGVVSGVSDLILVANSGVYFIELKTKTGKQSREQASFQKQMEEMGQNYVVIRDIYHFIDFVKSKMNTSYAVFDIE